MFSIFGVKLICFLLTLVKIKHILSLILSNQLKELYTLLNENYVEDDDNMFRFDYSPEFLLWYVFLERILS